MKSPFTTCRGCRTPDPTARWREDAHSILCVTCDLDAKRAEHFAPKAEAIVVTFSPACLRAMELS